MYLARAIELARRGDGATAPNPPVGAVLVRDGRSIGEGYHHRAGRAHAEREALDDAISRGEDPRGATLYVSLEPCAHHGRTPPCADAVVAAGVSRVVIGASDPNPRTAGKGLAILREDGLAVDLVNDANATLLIERFARAITSPFPFVTLKMAASTDGWVAPAPGRYPVTGAAARNLVRDLRATHDAVLVGAGTVRVDDPLLTVRPHRDRARPYVRIVACETDPVDAARTIFAVPADAPPGAYRRTIVLAPAGKRNAFASLANVAEVVLIGDDDAHELDLAAAMRALRDVDVTSVLCEGGPTLAGRLLAAGLVDRLVWLVAPSLLRTGNAVPSLAGADVTRYARGWAFDRVERLGDDVVLSGRLASAI